MFNFEKYFCGLQSIYCCVNSADGWCDGCPSRSTNCNVNRGKEPEVAGQGKAGHGGGKGMGLNTQLFGKLSDKGEEHFVRASSKALPLQEALQGGLVRALWRS